jgi:sirohydrochlorin ferrochelatase
MDSPAYLLVFHGSRDPRPALAATELAQLMSKQLSPQSLVKVASLEATTIPLHQQIIQLGDIAPILKIIPLFLLAGVHVCEDIPREVAQAQEVLGAKIKLEVTSHLGSYDLNPLLQLQLEQFSGDGGIFLAHGSRRHQSHTPLEARAAALGLIPAYWSVAPSLSEQVEKLVRIGKKRLTILPYFLFNGGTTEAIAQEVERLQNHYQGIELYLAQPLGATSQLAQIILQHHYAIG